MSSVSAGAIAPLTADVDSARNGEKRKHPYTHTCMDGGHTRTRAHTTHLSPPHARSGTGGS
jgi:hypothetical protein